MKVCEASKTVDEDPLLANSKSDLCLKKSFSDQCPDLVIDGLYIGNLFSASNKELLKGLGITNILIFASYIEPLFPDDFTYKQIEVHDLPNVDILSHLKECHS